jgi:hypothetical protein
MGSMRLYTFFMTESLISPRIYIPAGVCLRRPPPRGARMLRNAASCFGKDGLTALACRPASSVRASFGPLPADLCRRPIVFIAAFVLRLVA